MELHAIPDEKDRIRRTRGHSSAGYPIKRLLGRTTPAVTLGIKDPKLTIASLVASMDDVVGVGNQSLDQSGHPQKKNCRGQARHNAPPTV
jgi:hypothetical protein